jgi:AcrR family transcriptional regulator
MTNSMNQAEETPEASAIRLSDPRAPGASDPRAVRTAAVLRDAFFALLERKPYEDITIRDICAEANIHYATFYRHHPSKESMLDQIAAKQIEYLVELTLPIRDEQDDRVAFHALTDYVQDHRALWSVLLNGGAGPTMRAEWERQARKAAATRPAENSWLPVELGTICSVSLIVDVITWWLAQPIDAYSADEIANILDRLVTSSPMFTDHDPRR